LKLQELGPVRTCSAPRLRGLTQQRIPGSVQLPLKPIFLVLWRPLAFVGNHARHRRRNARFARHATRLFSHVDYLLLPPFHFAGKVNATARQKEAGKSAAAANGVAPRVTGTMLRLEKLNMSCKSMRRFAVDEEKEPTASPS